MSETYEPFDSEEDDDLYLKEPKSIRNFIEALNIFAKYTQEGFEETYFCQAEHDELFIHVEQETLHPNSPDGKRLRALGFHPSEVETWAYFT